MILFALITLAVLVLDWGSKFAAEELLGPSGGVVYNSKSPEIWAIPIALISTVIIMLICSGRLVVVGLTLLAGGCLANVIDRIAFGPVVDFIHLPDVAGTHYVANIADVAIFTGSVCLLIFVARMLITGRRDALEHKSEQIAERRQGSSEDLGGLPLAVDEPGSVGVAPLEREIAVEDLAEVGSGRLLHPIGGVSVPLAHPSQRGLGGDGEDDHPIRIERAASEAADRLDLVDPEAANEPLVDER